MGDLCTHQNGFNILITGNQSQISQENELIVLFCRNQMREELAMIENVLVLQNML